jgi:hypothetical protein
MIILTNQNIQVLTQNKAKKNPKVVAGSFNLRLYDYCADLSCGVVPRKRDKGISVFCIKFSLYSHTIKKPTDCIFIQ